MWLYKIEHFRYQLDHLNEKLSVQQSYAVRGPGSGMTGAHKANTLTNSLASIRASAELIKNAGAELVPKLRGHLQRIDVRQLPMVRPPLPEIPDAGSDSGDNEKRDLPC